MVESECAKQHKTMDPSYIAPMFRFRIGHPLKGTDYQTVVDRIHPFMATVLMVYAYNLYSTFLDILINQSVLRYSYIQLVASNQ